MAYQNLKQLIDAYFDNELSNSELRQFEEMLHSNPMLQKMLIRESYFNLQLRTGLTSISQFDLAINSLDEAVLLDQQMSQEPLLVPPIDMAPENFRGVLGTTILNVLSSAKFLWTIMLFSVGLFSLLIFMLIPTEWTMKGPQIVRRPTHVSQTVNAVWGEGIAPSDLKLLAKGSRLELVSGLAQVEYKNGVRVNLEGPAVFIVSGKDEGTLVSGKLAAQMAQTTEEFTIKTPIGKVVDLGTEFGIVVEENQNTSVQVFDGKVELAVSKKRGSSASEKTIELVESDAVRVNSSERTVTKIPYTPLRFARSYNKLRPYYYDDFATDTSNNYKTQAGNFSIKDDRLQVHANTDTCSVISKRPLLGAEAIFMVEVPGIDPARTEVYAVVSSQPTPPTGGAGGAFGFRLRREQGIVVEKFDSSKALKNADKPLVIEDTRIDDPLYGKTIRLVIERRTATDFIFHYESNDGRTQITERIQNPDLENFKRLHVGIEVRAKKPGDAKVFDNLVVYPTDVQEQDQEQVQEPEIAR